MHSQRERVWAFPLVSRRTAKRRLNHLYRLVLLVFVFLQANNLGFFFHTCSTLGPSPGVHTHPSAKMDLEVKASGRSKTLYGLELSPDFWHQGALVCLPYPLLKQGFFFFFTPSLYICHNYSLEMFAGGLYTFFNDYLPCFYCYFHFWKQTRGWL